MAADEEMEGWLGNQGFQVVLGDAQIGFARVSNLTAELEYDVIQEGGRNDGPVLVPKARSKKDTLTLERGMCPAPGGTVKERIRVGSVIAPVIITLLQHGKRRRVFTCDQAVVVRLELSGLDAMGHEILIEKMELAHGGLYEVEAMA